MNFKKIRPKNETDDLLLSITKNCEKLTEQTHRKAEEVLEFKMIKRRETFHFKPPIQFKGDWMIGLISLEVYISIFKINQGNKFEFYTDTFDEVSFTQLKDELEEILDISKTTDEHLQDEKTGPRIIKAYKKLETEKRQTDGYYMSLLGHARSLFRDFESYLRIVVGLDEDDF